MKKLIFLLAFLPTALFSQVYVDKYDINSDEQIHYCEVTYWYYTAKKNGVCFDYGQKLNRKGLAGTARTRVFGNDKKEVFFNGMIDIMNFMTNNGWEIFDGPYPATEYSTARCVFMKARE